MTPTQENAIQLCRVIENYAPLFGYHVGLTGGCLYKDGPRKDIDLCFYPAGNNEGKNENLNGLLDQLAKIGLGLENHPNTKYDGKKVIMSGLYLGVKVDCFFPKV